MLRTPRPRRSLVAQAVYTNPLTGAQVEGREAIAKEFESVLAELDDTK